MAMETTYAQQPVLTGSSASLASFCLLVADNMGTLASRAGLGAGAPIAV